MHVLTLKHVHVASTQGHMVKKPNAMSQLSYYQMMIRSNALQQTGKQCSSFSSVVLVCVSNSELLLEYCHIIFQWLGFIRIEQCFTLGLEIEIISFLLDLYSWRQNKPQTVPAEKKKTARGSGTDLLEFFIFKSCGLSGGRKLVFWKVSWQGSRVSPLDQPTEYNPADLNKHKRFVVKKKDLSRAKSFVPRKKIHGQKVDSNFTNL